MIHLLKKYRQKNVVISLDNSGENIRITGDLTSLTASDKAELKENKESLLAFLIDQKNAKVSIPVIDEVPEQIPLTPNQRSIWVHCQMEQDRTLYTIPAYTEFELPGFDLLLFEASLKKMAENFPILTYVFKQNNGIPYQIATDFNLSNHFQFIDEPEVDSDKAIEESLNQGFHLDALPPWNLLLFKAANGIYKCFLKMHHIVSDGETVQLFFSNLLKTYQSLDQGLEINSDGIKYRDYAIWLNDKSNQKSSSEYWKSAFNDYSESFSLPQDDHLEDKATKAVYQHEFTTFVTSDIKEFTVARRATPTALYSLVLGVVLRHKSGSNDFVLGIPSAGRSLPQLSNVLGDCVNTLPLRLKFDRGTVVEEQLINIQNDLYLGLEHQMYPFEYVLEDIGYQYEPGNSPLFNILLSVPNNQELKRKKEVEEVSAVSKYDLTFTFLEYENALELKVEYNGAKYREETVQLLVARVERAFKSILDNHSVTLDEIEILTAEEKKKVLEEFNDTEVHYDKSMTILDGFKSIVDANPEAIAVARKEHGLTYRELDDRSTRLSNFIRQEFQLKNESLVAIMLPRTTDLVVAMLAVLKSGCAYVPVDLNYPAERIQFIKEDSRYEVCIDSQLMQQFESKYAAISSVASDPNVSMDQLAYIIYTSGSTGKPNGVMIQHGNLSAFLHWCQSEFGKLSYDTTLFTTSVCFDLSIFEVFYTLFSGKTIEVLEDALEVAECLERKKNVLLNTVPSAVKTLLLQGINWQNVNILNMAGEPIPASVVHDLEGKVSEVRNLYGPSEDTTYSTCYRITSSDEVTIGTPISNTKVYILNDALQPVGINEAGEICLSGDGVARGYLNRPELTAEKFVTNPSNGERMYKTGDIGKWMPNGQIQYLGRADDQLKIRGFRIELGEIEYHLNKIQGVEAVVLAKKSGSGDQELVAFYSTTQEVSSEQLTTYLSELLPHYMVPSSYTKVREIPLTSNGKTDKRMLLSMEANSDVTAEYVAPENQIEEDLVAIWQEVLEKERIGVLDNFFELGGHSLKAIRILTIVEDRMGVKLDFNKIFNAQTVRALALEIENTLWLNLSSTNEEVKKVII